MGPNSTLVLLLLVVSTTVGKYVYIKKNAHWTEAQTHCRNHYTDLAPINSEADTRLLQQLVDKPDVIRAVPGYIWFGLVRNTTDPDKWLWSGGGEATTFYWDKEQPTPGLDEMYGLLINYMWHDAPSWMATYFFCYSVHAVREEKTWDEALQYCRKNHKDLATISSETEMMLIQKELNKDVSTQHVWMGLHFLSGDWLWVDGQTPQFEAWGWDKPQCPGTHMSCGALVFSSEGVKEWKAQNCEDRLHFICY